jgi:hypothetical protein
VNIDDELEEIKDKKLTTTRINSPWAILMTSYLENCVLSTSITSYSRGWSSIAGCSRKCSLDKETRGLLYRKSNSVTVFLMIHWRGKPQNVLTNVARRHVVPFDVRPRILSLCWIPHNSMDYSTSFQAIYWSVRITDL